MKHFTYGAIAGVVAMLFISMLGESTQHAYQRGYDDGRVLGYDAGRTKTCNAARKLDARLADMLKRKGLC